MDYRDHPALPAMMGTYPKTDALKAKALTSDLFTLDYGPVDVAQKAFKAVVRDLKYDVAELAIVTFLQAFAQGRPYVLLPFVMNGGFHHKSILCREDSPLTPHDLAGRRIGGRAYTQTTPTWVRGILMDDYGLKLDSVEWLSQEEAHVSGYENPPWVRQMDSALSLEQMLIAGEVDAVMGGQLAGDARVRSLIPDAKQAALDWYARHKVVPINHMIAVRRELAEQRPDIVRALFGMLRESRRLGEGAPVEDAIDLLPSGFDAVRPGVEMIMRFALEQALIPRAYAFEDLFGPVIKALA
ncbi:MAG TPA: hypothetical protein VMU59_15340 [Caulobacteraceae bacterium]|nr:hypothetical protein [Caulobacteraceae bacterium]